ncbi:hypothetical protein D3C78_1602230 [compost metagenome]
MGVLEKRQNDDPFITELRKLENQLDFLRNIDVKFENASVLTRESIAEVPETPIEPQKTLILLLGIALGSILGVFVALIRYALKRHSITHQGSTV